jgi:serine/threonine-protein kinase
VTQVLDSSIDGDVAEHGSTRFMAPEELTQGAVIDERTTVFDLGRTAAVLLDEGDAEGRFRGTEAMAAVVAKATRVERAERHASVEAFVAEWRRAVADSQ